MLLVASRTCSPALQINNPKPRRISRSINCDIQYYSIIKRISFFQSILEMEKARTVGVGMDYSSTSKAALRWAAENLIGEGDRIILIQVQPPNADHTRRQLFEGTGSPLVPLAEFREINFSKQYGLTYDPEVLDILDEVSRTKGAEVAAKVYWGDPREKLIDAVDDLKLDSLVMGSRGLGAIKRVLLGSVSNYVVTNAPCPVTVVKGSKP